MFRITRAILLVPAILLAPAGPSAGQPVITDSLYSAHHPRLIYTDAAVDDLRSKVQDGGRDDEAYLFIRDLVQNVYPSQEIELTLGPWYGDGAILEIGLVSRIESPPDLAARELGKAITLHIANTWEPDFDEAHSGMRLRALALGYDMFFTDATEAERALVRDEMVRYVQKMIWNPGYHLFMRQPYLANHSAMFAAALGLAAIALQGETEAYICTDAMAMADGIVAELLLYQFDETGSYNEGTLYALWTLKNLIVYFDARKRFDGYDYAAHPRLRAVERWLAYELLPEGGALSHNLNDSVMQETPLARSTAYFDWAMNEWGSGLSAWLWEHAAGAYGVDLGPLADKAATVLWHRPVTPVSPAGLLPKHRLFVGRGLYHFRTGWQEGDASDDVVFCFYSGKFQGGHAQEDQNQFALYGYGERLVIDHGPGTIAKQSEAHNMVFVDGAGQHNAGQSIGTDGEMSEYLLGGIADYLVGDATRAYATYSEFNAPNRPYDGTDWSWGYRGSNPVEFAKRRVLVVHGEQAPPYFLLLDDIRKDGAIHDYEWRMHTLSWNEVDAGANPITITGTTGALDLHLLHPPFDSVTVSVDPFDNGTSELDAKLLRIGRTAVEPSFAFLLVPKYNGEPGPHTTRHEYPWGFACTLDWGTGIVDHVLHNRTGQPGTHAHIESDARVTLVREWYGALAGYLAANVTRLAIGGTTHVTVANGPMTCELSGSTLFVDRYDADFRVRNPGITRLLYRDQDLGFVVDGDDVIRGGATPVGDPVPPARALAVFAYPNPFNPATTLRVDGDPAAPTRVSVYDVAGRLVRRLWDAPLGAGSRTLHWDGRNDAGNPVASGAYLVRARTSFESRAAKVWLLK